MNLQELFNKESEKLSPREKDVLRLCFGLDDYKPRTAEEIAELFGVSAKEIDAMIPKALSKITDFRDELQKRLAYNLLLGCIFAERIDSINTINYDELKKDIDTILEDDFSENEIKVLNLRFGLVDGPEKTLNEIGKEMNLSGERIRQLEGKVLRKLRNPKRNKCLEKYLPKERVREHFPNIDEELLNFDK